MMSLESYALKLGSVNCPNNYENFFKFKRFSSIQVNGEAMETHPCSTGYWVQFLKRIKVPQNTTIQKP